MIYRHQIRTVLDSTETTLKTRSLASDALSFELDETNAFYLGFHERFTTRYFYFSEANSNAQSISAEYWNGTGWVSVTGLKDLTNGFQNNGFLSWTNESDWKKMTLSPVTDEELYWIRITVGDALSAGTSLQAVLNLFCDQAGLAEWYPELVSDSRYLPPNRSDFIEQLHAGKNTVVQELIQKGAIQTESQILDINEVWIAAVHATANVIWEGIPSKSEDQVERGKMMREAMDYWLDRIRLSADVDDSGEIEADEEEIPFTFIPRR